jgi:hypothetical protein
MRDKQLVEIINMIYDCLNVINRESHIDLSSQLTPLLEELKKEIDSTGY